MERYIVRLRYRADSGKLCYVYATDRGTKTPDKRLAYKFRRKDNALAVARLLSKWNSKFDEGKVIKL